LLLIRRVVPPLATLEERVEELVSALRRSTRIVSEIEFLRSPAGSAWLNG